jgi:hypothetical protein
MLGTGLGKIKRVVISRVLSKHDSLLRMSVSLLRKLSQSADIDISDGLLKYQPKLASGIC